MTPDLRFQPHSLMQPLAAALATMLLAAGSAASAQTEATGATDATEAPRAQDDKVRIGTIVITGRGDRLGAGQMLNEDATKARSTLTRAATEKDRATGNPLQALALLPSINSFSHDGTGLFGGGLTVRGFNADQLGFTVNGVPVNDSGNFALYPQEYVDQENICTESIAQGSPDVDSPHAGATGGNISLTTCDPENQRRARLSQTLGGLGLTRTYLRLDSGRFAADRAKVFLSYSHTEAEKWKGEGRARRDHFDAVFRFDLDADNAILGSLLYNRAVNHNIYNPTLAELNSKGYFVDYATTFTPHLPPAGGSTQAESAQSPLYYGLSLNPFENVIASVSGSFKLGPNTSLKVQPYLWYGFGNGGWSERALRETSGLLGGAVDLNGDGDTIDTVRVARASITRTQRPGITAEINTSFGAHSLRAGLWYERAEHRQTRPVVRIDADGTPADRWLRECMRRVDGSCYQGRDWDTVSTAWQAYLSDAIAFDGERGTLTLALRTPHVRREVSVIRSEGENLPDYRIDKSFSTVLPQVGLRYQIDRANHVFINVAKNFKAPPNFAYTGANVRVVNGVVLPYADVRPETSVMTDLGWRLQTPRGSVSATLFSAEFKNRQADAFDPNNLVSTYQNAGRTRNRGLELEAGSAAFGGGFTLYGSLTLQRSRLKDDLAVSATASLPTAGKQMTLTPETMLGAALQYASGPWYARLKLKYTGRQYATLMNDEEVPAYTVGDLDLGYRFADQGWLKQPTLRMNVSNIGNARYRNPSSGSVANAQPYGAIGAASSAPTYYVGAPRLLSFSLSADFQ